MDIIQVNRKAELKVNFNGEQHIIMCDVKGITTDTVVLFCPIESRELALKSLTNGSKIDLNVYSYSGIIVLTSYVKRIQFDTIVIDYPEEKERIQRREYFRIGIQRPINISYNDGYKDRNYVGKTIDISGGGVRFWTQEHCQVGFMAEVVMHVEDLCGAKEPIEASGRIIYVKNHDSRFTSKSGYISVVKFHEISPKSRQLIMQTCFKIQIEMRKKGII